MPMAITFGPPEPVRLLREPHLKYGSAGSAFEVQQA